MFKTDQKHPTSGFYVCFEGIDGCGKTSIIKTLSQKKFPNLKKTELVHPKVTRMPGGTEFSELHRHACISANISHGVQALFYSALHLDTHQRTINPFLDQNELVISDRGFGSAVCYQGVAAGLQNMELMTALLSNLPEIRTADLTIYLDLPLEMGLARTGNDGRDADRFLQFSMKEKETLKESYDLLYKATRVTRHITYDKTTEGYISGLLKRVTDKTVVIDASKDPLTVAVCCYETIRAAIFEKAGFLPSCPPSKLGQLPHWSTVQQFPELTRYSSS